MNIFFVMSINGTLFCLLAMLCRCMIRCIIDVSCIWMTKFMLLLFLKCRVVFFSFVNKFFLDIQLLSLFEMIVGFSNVIFFMVKNDLLFLWSFFRGSL